MANVTGDDDLVQAALVQEAKFFASLLGQDLERALPLLAAAAVSRTEGLVRVPLVNPIVDDNAPQNFDEYELVIKPVTVDLCSVVAERVIKADPIVRPAQPCNVGMQLVEKHTIGLYNPNPNFTAYIDDLDCYPARFRQGQQGASPQGGNSPQQQGAFEYSEKKPYLATRALYRCVSKHSVEVKGFENEEIPPMRLVYKLHLQHAEAQVSFNNPDQQIGKKRDITVAISSPSYLIAQVENGYEVLLPKVPDNFLMHKRWQYLSYQAYRNTVNHVQPGRVPPTEHMDFKFDVYKITQDPIKTSQLRLVNQVDVDWNSPAIRAARANGLGAVEVETKKRLEGAYVLESTYDRHQMYKCDASGNMIHYETGCEWEHRAHVLPRYGFFKEEFDKLYGFIEARMKDGGHLTLEMEQIRASYLFISDPKECHWDLSMDKWFGNQRVKVHTQRIEEMVKGKITEAMLQTANQRVCMIEAAIRRLNKTRKMLNKLREWDIEPENAGDREAVNSWMWRSNEEREREMQTISANRASNAGYNVSPPHFRMLEMEYRTADAMFPTFEMDSDSDEEPFEIPPVADHEAMDLEDVSIEPNPDLSIEGMDVGTP